jgi:hypothetical protein
MTTNLLPSIILDASARRHQAHKIYLKVAAVKRWVIRFENLKSHSMEHVPIDRLRQVDNMLSNVGANFEAFDSRNC